MAEHKKTHPIEKLVGLGLNRLESEVYAFLLTNSPMTAYAVAKQMGTATANTYKAIDTLARRGAVLIEEGENRICRAVPAKEFLRHLERSFLEQTHEVEAALARLERKSFDERVYKLESVPQMLQRARQMIAERCTKVAVVDAFPAALQLLLPSIQVAVKKGITVFVQAYREIEIEGAHVVTPAMGEQVRDFWGSEQLNVVIDGRECLLALLDTDIRQIYQGLWSNSLYLSCLLFAGIKSEHTIHRLRECMGQKDEYKRMKHILKTHGFFLNSQVPGQIELLARFVKAETR